MDKRELVKIGANIVVSTGVGMICGYAINAFVPNDIGRLKRTFVQIGGLALTGVVTTAAMTWTDSLVDAAFAGYSDGRARVEAKAAMASYSGDQTKEFPKHVNDDAQNTLNIFNSKDCTDVN